MAIKIIHINTDSERQAVLADINAYILQTENANERACYQQELYEVGDDWVKLVNSGVFHDAIGKVAGIYKCDKGYAVDIITKY